MEHTLVHSGTKWVGTILTNMSTGLSKQNPGTERMCVVNKGSPQLGSRGKPKILFFGNTTTFWGVYQCCVWKKGVRGRYFPTANTHTQLTKPKHTKNNIFGTQYRKQNLQALYFLELLCSKTSVVRFRLTCVYVLCHDSNERETQEEWLLWNIL